VDTIIPLNVLNIFNSQLHMNGIEQQAMPMQECNLFSPWYSCKNFHLA